jgi:predicted transposase/invertase (TIGR01784 family)
MNMLAEKSPELKKAVGVLMELSEDERNRMLYEAQEKARRDQAARMTGTFQRGLEQGLERGLEQGLERGLEQGLERGLEQGLEQGAEQTRIRIARSMLAKNTSMNFIVEVTGLTEGTINKLRRDD